MSEPIDSYGATWPSAEPVRDDLAKLRTELEVAAERWVAVAHTDTNLLNNPAFTDSQRERLRGAISALRRCARELREAIKGAA